jgi:hypothetical protein
MYELILPYDNAMNRLPKESLIRTIRTINEDGNLH